MRRAALTGERGFSAGASSDGAEAFAFFFLEAEEREEEEKVIAADREKSFFWF